MAYNNSGAVFVEEVTIAYVTNESAAVHQVRRMGYVEQSATGHPVDAAPNTSQRQTTQAVSDDDEDESDCCTRLDEYCECCACCDTPCCCEGSQCCCCCGGPCTCRKWAKAIGYPILGITGVAVCIPFFLLRCCCSCLEGFLSETSLSDV